MGEAPDLREQEDCPSPEACDRACDQHGTAEDGALAAALCHEYHPMHWDVAYGKRNRACEACKAHAARLIASGWRVFPPGSGDVR